MKFIILWTSPLSPLSGAFQKEKLAPGCEVEVTMADGSAAKGFFCSFRGKVNVEILMDILKRQVRATVPLDRVRRSGILSGYVRFPSLASSRSRIASARFTSPVAASARK